MEEENLKKLERQKRFGIVSESEEDKLKKRRERFGPTNHNEVIKYSIYLIYETMMIYLLI